MIAVRGSIRIKAAGRPVIFTKAWITIGEAPTIKLSQILKLNPIQVNLTGVGNNSAISDGKKANDTLRKNIKSVCNVKVHTKD